MVLIKLMKHECSTSPPFICEVIPTALVSFYTKTKEDEKDSTDAINNLVARFDEILTLNPWLTGRLVRQKEDGNTQEYLSYDENVSCSKLYGKVVLDVGLFSLRDGFSPTDYLATFNIKKGKYCINEDEILCQLIIFHDSSMSKMAVMFSLNHCIGDAATCYAIWSVSFLCS